MAASQIYESDGGTHSVPDHIDPTPFPETLRKERCRCGLIDMNPAWPYVVTQSRIAESTPRMDARATPIRGVVNGAVRQGAKKKTPPSPVGPEGAYSITPRSARLVKSDSVMIRWS